MSEVLYDKKNLQEEGGGVGAPLPTPLGTIGGWGGCPFLADFPALRTENGSLWWFIKVQNNQIALTATQPYSS